MHQLFETGSTPDVLNKNDEYITIRYRNRVQKEAQKCTASRRWNDVPHYIQAVCHRTDANLEALRVARTLKAKSFLQRPVSGISRCHLNIADIR